MTLATLLTGRCESGQTISVADCQVRRLFVTSLLYASVTPRYIMVAHGRLLPAKVVMLIFCG